jgi:serine/threonine-protein kinase
VLGRGGIGVVYRARDERLGRNVAVKVIHVSNAAPEVQETLRGRFRREARCTSCFHYPAIRP